MTDPTQTLLDAVAAATAANADDASRLRSALPADLSSLRQSTAAPAVAAPALSVVQPDPPRRAMGWRLAAGVSGLAAAAGVALALWPAPGPTDAPLSVDLATLGPAGDLQLDGLGLVAHGVGALEGTDAQPTVRWEQGSVRLDVDPTAGRRVRVETPDGAVEVLGTIFRVTRDPLGTEVAVERGRVAFACTSGAVSELAAGESSWCLPTTAGGLLGRARALDAAGAAPDAVLATLDAGLAVAGPGSALSVELSYRRLPVLVALDRPAQAAAAGVAYLAAGHALHRGPVAAQTVALAVSVGDCEAARAAVAAADSPAPPLGPCDAPPR